MEPDEISEEKYFRVIHNKTASLFAAAGEMAVVLAEGDETKRALGNSLGMHIGMAFQIVDDTLDYIGEEEELGKAVLSDINSGTITLPLISLITGNDTVIDAEQLMRGEVTTEEAVAMRHLVVENGGIDYAMQHASEHIRKAQSIIGDIMHDDEEASSLFAPFFDMILYRNT
jgi:octaprenyl-diphosphate synthase